MEIEINGKKYEYNIEKIKLYEFVKIHKYDNKETPVVANIKRKYILKNVLYTDYLELPETLFFENVKSYKGSYHDNEADYIEI